MGYPCATNIGYILHDGKGEFVSGVFQFIGSKTSNEAKWEAFIVGFNHNLWAKISRDQIEGNSWVT